MIYLSEENSKQAIEKQNLKIQIEGFRTCIQEFDQAKYRLSDLKKQQSVIRKEMNIFISGIREWINSTFISNNQNQVSMIKHDYEKLKSKFNLEMRKNEILENQLQETNLELMNTKNRMQLEKKGSVSCPKTLEWRLLEFRDKINDTKGEVRRSAALISNLFSSIKTQIVSVITRKQQEQNKQIRLFK